MVIWGRYEDRKPEKVDDIPKHDVYRCLHEYKLAFGKGWTLWVGRLKDEPNTRTTPYPTHSETRKPCGTLPRRWG